MFPNLQSEALNTQIKLSCDDPNLNLNSTVYMQMLTSRYLKRGTKSTYYSCPQNISYISQESAELI